MGGRQYSREGHWRAEVRDNAHHCCAHLNLHLTFRVKKEIR